MYRVLYYQTVRGTSPVDEFLSDLDVKSRAKALRLIDYLEVHGPNLVRPYADVVSGKIRELRIRFSSTNVRILYFFFFDREMILVHSFFKKTEAINPREIQIAQNRMADWISRYGNQGGVK